MTAESTGIGENIENWGEMWPSGAGMQVGKSTGRGGGKSRKGPPIKGQTAKRSLGPVARKSVVIFLKMVEDREPSLDQ